MNCNSTSFWCSRPRSVRGSAFSDRRPRLAPNRRLQFRTFPPATCKASHSDRVASQTDCLHTEQDSTASSKAASSSKCTAGLSKEHKEKISIALRKKWQDPAFRKKIAETKGALSKNSEDTSLAVFPDKEGDSLEVGPSVKESLRKKEELAEAKRKKISAALKRKWQDPEFRKRISEGVKKKWEDEEYREKVSNALKGKKSWNKGKKVVKLGSGRKKKSTKKVVPWNKGRSSSADTRERMRAAKLGTTHSEATKRKMSASHTGLAHTPETMRILSRKLSGVPKGTQHKARIAASQRKRLTAIRALKAVETVHQRKGPLFSGRKGARYVLCATSTTIGESSGLKMPKRQTRAEVLNSHKTQLREYRALQAELSPWMNAFMERHGKRPTMVDVESTKITWLIDRFKDYTVLREKLLVDIPVLRSKIANAQNDLPKGPRDINFSGPPCMSHDEISEKLAAARQYRRALNGKQLFMEDELQASSPVAPARVEKAMNAAMEYRRKQARASAAVANAAVVNARSTSQEAKLEVTSKNHDMTKVKTKETEISKAQEQADIAIQVMKDAQQEVIEVYSLGGTP